MPVYYISWRTTRRIDDKVRDQTLPFEVVLSGQGWCNCEKCPEFDPEIDNCPYEPLIMVSKFSAENEDQAWEIIDKYWTGFTKRFIQELTGGETNRFGL